ncbi:MAG: S8 family serine peptidase [Leptolyngbyaceae cyanobacterium MAG.088]|nr:S8 family serine peptidase [Leptolyngbyaceae cyanobacterium MAG.088]
MTSQTRKMPMTDLLLTEIDVNNTDSIFTDGGITVAPSSYGLDLSNPNHQLSAPLEIDTASEKSADTQLSNQADAFVQDFSDQVMLYDTFAESYWQGAFDSDTLIGIDSQESLILNNTPNSSSTIFEGLFHFVSFNPTRLYSYKDDYLLVSQTTGEVQLNLDSFQFDAYLQIVDITTGQVLAFDDDGGNSTNAELTFTAEADTQYLVRATSYWAFEIGSYSLTASFSPGEPPTTPPSGFDSTYGYGLVDAATAVAEAIDQPQFDDVADIGGNQWNNDMINAPEVWAQGYTGEGITVAVIDSGVDIYHEDLSDNIWINTDEILNDGIDNDGNGYIDDYYGWNFGQGQNNNNVLPGTDTSGQGHGTHVAGTIAAANNGIGMTGVAHDANIMAIRMGDVSNNGVFENAGNLAEAIYYAVDNGADVINMSLGWSDPTGSIYNAMAYAAANNVITVTAAGNSALAAPGSPAYYATEYGISVGAVDNNSDIAYFSNEAGTDSDMVHVMAPGVDIYSTTPDDTYGYQQGTSMAAPHVAGVVALMLSANPDLTHDQVREILSGTSTLNDTSTESPALPVQATQFSLNDEIIDLVANYSLTNQSQYADFFEKMPFFNGEIEGVASEDTQLAADTGNRDLLFSYTDDWQFQLPKPFSDDLLAPVLV